MGLLFGLGTMMQLTAPASFTTMRAVAQATELIHTTRADFDGCSTLDQMMISSFGDGALQLAPVFADTFDGPTLDDALWVAGTWSDGPFSPTLNGTVEIGANDGAYIRSADTFSHITLEGEVTFGNASFQHFGLGTLGFGGDRYALFSTFNTNNTLFARLNNSASEQRVDLGPLPTGTHTYRIEWSSDLCYRWDRGSDDDH